LRHDGGHSRDRGEEQAGAGHGAIECVRGDHPDHAIPAGAEGSIIRNLGLIGGWTSGDADYHALHLRTKATIRDLYIERWQGEGIFGNVSIGSGGATEGEANNTEVSRVYIENTRNGLHVAGGDFNASTFKAIDCKAVRASAIWDEALINNTHIGHHAAACGAAPYRLDKSTARTMLIGCYAESGQPASKVVFPNVVIGGFFGSGFTSDSTGMRISADGGFDVVASSDGKYQLGQTTAALASSGADKILTVHNKAALGASIPGRLSFAMGYEVDGVTPCQLADFYAVTNTSSPSTAEAKARLAFRAYSTGVMTDQIEWDNINFVHTAGRQCAVGLGQGRPAVEEPTICPATSISAATRWSPRAADYQLTQPISRAL
jgi:hypothetical protein